MGRLIKWDGEAPAEPEAYANPEAHPACAEVIEFDEHSDGNTARIVYKREESNNGTD